MVVRINNPKNIQGVQKGVVAKIEDVAKGDIWILPTSQDLSPNQDFDIEVMMNTGGKDVGAFNVSLDFDSSKINIDISKGVDITSDTGRGFAKGSNMKEYTVMSNSGEISKGHFRLAGIGVIKTTNGVEKQMAIIHAKTTATFTSGSTELTLEINEFSDKLGHTILTDKNSAITITVN